MPTKAVKKETKKVVDEAIAEVETQTEDSSEFIDVVDSIVDDASVDYHSAHMAIVDSAPQKPRDILDEIDFSQYDGSNAPDDDYYIKTMPDGAMFIDDTTCIMRDGTPVEDGIYYDENDGRYKLNSVNYRRLRRRAVSYSFDGKPSARHYGIE